MKFESPNISLAAFGAAVGVASAAGFQVGYFREVGLQFISMASFSDALLVAAAIVPTIGFFFIQAVENIAEMKRLFSFKSAKIVAAIVLASAVLSYLASGAWIAWQITTAALSTIIVLWLAVQMASSASVIMEAVEADCGEVHWSHYNAILVGAFVTSVFVGGWGLGGKKECGLVLDKARFEQAEYLRTVNDGYLFRIDGRTHFIPKSEVKEFWCGALPMKSPPIPKYAPTVPGELTPKR